MEGDYKYPPRWNPDNSPEARAQRIARHIHVVARVVETNRARYILGPNNQIVSVQHKEEPPEPNADQL